MTFPCFLLGKVSRSYTYTGAYQVEGGATVRNVTQGVRKLASVCHEWELADIEITLYMPVPPLGITKDKTRADIEKLLLDTVTDKYLRANCCRVVSGTKLVPSPECLIATVTFSIDYIVFERIGNDEHLRFQFESKARGLPTAIVELVQNLVRQATGKVLEAEERGILTIDVYETNSSCDAVKDAIQGNTLMVSMTLLTPSGMEQITPHGRGCLFIELKTEAYIPFKYYLFTGEMAQHCAFVGIGWAKGLPRQTLKVVEEAAHNSFMDGLPSWEAETTSTRISIYKLRDELRYEKSQGPVNPQLTPTSFENDLVQYSTGTELDQVAQTLVVVSTVETSKRPLAPACEGSNATDRATIAALACKREPPSEGAKHSALLVNQCEERQDAVYNHRPHILTGPPIQIYNPAFVTFIREMSHPHDAIEFSDEELEKALNFINTSLDLHEHEFDRRVKMDYLRVLGRLLTRRVQVDAGEIILDGIVGVSCPTAAQEATVCIVEVQNEIGEGDSDPIMQAECDFVLICSSKKYEPFRNASCCPMFLVGVAGPHLAVSGAIFTERFISQRLTDYIYLGPLPTLHGRSSLDNSIRRVAQVLRVLDKATNELADYYSRLQFTLSPMTGLLGATDRAIFHPPPVPLHPITSRVAPPSFREYVVDGKKYTVDYETRLAPSFPDKAVFKGTIALSGDSTKHSVVVKFTQMYCEDAHQKLAEVGRAPFLQFCERVESVGMFIVVMDYVGGEHARKPLRDGGHIAQLREAMKTLHDAGYVHGDLREPNVLLTADGLKIVDFDWCGKEGTARYPADISLVPDLEWHERVYCGGLITKDHDEHMFEVLTGSSYWRRAMPDIGSPQ